MDAKFSFAKRIASFKHGFNGLKILFREEHNARIHLFAAIVTILLGVLLSISRMEWIVIIFAICLVIAFEIVNTAIENIADFISPEKNESIKRIKDLAAASVLICAIGSLIVGSIIFVPKIYLLIS